VYVAPPDRHLRLDGDTLRLDAGPQVNGHRPAIDPLFRSAAETHNGRTAGVILSGTLDDGTVGLHIISEQGGATLVQDPDDALYRAMPANAIDYTTPTFVLPVEELASELVGLTGSWNGSAGRNGDVPDDAPNPTGQEDAQPGRLAPFSCPECGGTLWETHEGKVTSYRCRVGHAFSMNSLAAKHAESVERALWSAYRALEERAAVSERIARRLERNGRGPSAARFERQANQAARQAAELKDVLDTIEPAVDAGDEVRESTG
jgi:two-component system chemotaxis response regulator CheB